MPKILSEEKQRYEKAFGDSWEIIFNFFYTQLDFGGASAADRKIHVKSRRFACAKELINTYGIAVVISAMAIYSEKLKLGILSNKSVPYFKKIVENSVVKEPVVKKFITYVPVPKQKVTDNYERQFFNWLYSCPACSTETDAWNERCPKCKIFFDWGKVHVN
jgi:hypothetical protein